MINKGNYSFIRTSKSPEQYEVYKITDDHITKVGCVRLSPIKRQYLEVSTLFGRITCECPGCGGEIIYDKITFYYSDGQFNSNKERLFHLELIAKEIQKWEDTRVVNKKFISNRKITTLQDLKTLINSLGYEDVVLFDSPSYVDACIGISEDNRAVYDYNKMVETLVKDGMTTEEAEVFIEYNTLRALPHIPDSPIVITQRFDTDIPS